MDDKTSDDTAFYLLASVGAVVAVALLSTVAMALDKEEAGYHAKLALSASTATIVTELMAGHSKCGRIIDTNGLNNKRQYTYWDRDGVHLPLA